VVINCCRICFRNLKNHHFIQKASNLGLVCVCACMYVCVCVRERESINLNGVHDNLHIDKNISYYCVVWNQLNHFAKTIYVCVQKWMSLLCGIYDPCNYFNIRSVHISYCVQMSLSLSAQLCVCACVCVCSLICYSLSIYLDSSGDLRLFKNCMRSDL